MSWSTETIRPAMKQLALQAIDDLTVDYPPDRAVYPAVMHQLQVAKDCAKLLLKSIPGPYVMVRLNGHANGAGLNAIPGLCDDVINVSVTQVTQGKYDKCWGDGE